MKQVFTREWNECRPYTIYITGHWVILKSQKVHIHIKCFFQAEISSSEVSRSHTLTMAGQNFERATGGLNIAFSV